MSGQRPGRSQRSLDVDLVVEHRRAEADELPGIGSDAGDHLVLVEEAADEAVRVLACDLAADESGGEIAALRRVNDDSRDRRQPSLQLRGERVCPRGDASGPDPIVEGEGLGSGARRSENRRGSSAARRQPAPAA